MGKAFVVWGEVERWYGAACCLVGWNWPEACTAAVVAPGEGGPAFVVIVRAVLEPWIAFWDEEGLWEYEVAAAADWELAAFWMADWARKAARKFEKKGRLVDMVSRSARIQGAGQGAVRELGCQDQAEAAVAMVDWPLAVVVECSCSAREGGELGCGAAGRGGCLSRPSDVSIGDGSGREVCGMMGGRRGVAVDLCIC